MLWLVAAVAGVPTPAPPVLNGTCPPLQRPVDTVLEAKPTIYADPDNNQDEPGRVLRADGVAVYTFTDVGTLDEPKLCPGSTTRYLVTQTRLASSAWPRCSKQVVEPVTTCEDPEPEDPANFAPPPEVDPEFDENVPPGEGPPGAVTVDKPAP